MVAVAVEKSVAHMWKWHWSSCKMQVAGVASADVSFPVPCSGCCLKLTVNIAPDPQKIHSYQEVEHHH